MRSTVNLQNSLDRELRKRAERLGLSFKEALNRAVAAGLHALDISSHGAANGFTVKAKNCGIKPGFDLLHLNRIAAELDDAQLGDKEKNRKQ